MKLKQQLIDIRYLMNTSLIKKIIILSVSIGICGTFSYKSISDTRIISEPSYIPNLIDAIIDIVSNNVFPILLFFILMLFSTITIFNSFEQNNMYIFRLETKKKYFEKLIKNLFITNTITFIIICLILVVVSYFFASSTIIIKYDKIYKTINIIYLFFFLFRVFCLSQILSITSIMLFKVINYRYVLLMNLLIFAYSLGLYYEAKPINSLLQIKFNLASYLTILNYTNFYLEVMISCAYILFLIMISSLIFEFSYRQVRDIGD